MQQLRVISPPPQQPAANSRRIEPEKAASQGQVRLVDHFAVERDCPGIGICGKRGDDLACPGEFLLADGKGAR